MPESYCRPLDGERQEGVCAFHRAMKEVHDETVRILARWRLSDLLQRPGPAPEVSEPDGCKLAFVEWERHLETE